MLKQGFILLGCAALIVFVRRRSVVRRRKGMNFFHPVKIQFMKNKTQHTPDASTRNDDPKNLRRESTAPSEQKEEKKLPGEYPPQEDIMNRRDQQRVGLDEENFTRAVGHENNLRPKEAVVSEGNDVLDEPVLGNVEDLEEPAAIGMERPVPKNLNIDDDATMEFATGNESDVTQEDLQALGPKDLSLDMGEDEELLKNRVWPVDMAGKDLDIPGSEEASDNTEETLEDEENDFYSLGGDRLEDNMEGK